MPTPDREPWTGKMRERVADACHWLRSVAVKIERGKIDVERVQLGPARRSIAPAKTARVMARELLRGDCLASKAVFEDVQAFHEAIHRKLPEQSDNPVGSNA